MPETESPLPNRKCQISLEHRTTKPSYLRVLQTTPEDIVNKGSMIKKGEKLTEIELNPPKPENVRYLQSADTHTSSLFGPLNDNVVDCKQALDHKKWLKID